MEATKGILDTGMCWRVGIGSTIEVRTDAWLPRGPNQNIQSNINDGSIQMVADSIDPITRAWKEGTIQNTFGEDDVQRILSIPLARVPHDNFRAWSGEALGEFTVRSAYR